MRTAVLNRTETGDQGTFGFFILDDGTKFACGELPWRGDQTDISCLPPAPGETSESYTAVWALSQKHGWCYHIQGDPRRKNIEIHSANWMGDASKGLQCQLEGCLALGRALGMLEGQKAVLQSQDAIRAFHENMNGVSFQLIVNAAPATSTATAE